MLKCPAMDGWLSRGPRQGPLGIFVGAYAVLFGLMRLMDRPALRKLMVVPLMLTGVLYLGALVGVVTLGDDLLGLFWAQPDNPWMLTLWWFGAILLMAVSLLTLALLFTTVAELVGGPYFDKMAVRVLHDHQIATREPGMFEGFVPDLLRSLAFPVGVLVFGLFGLIPVIGLLFVIVGTGIAWLGFASAAINPALAVTEHSVGQRVAWLRQNFMTSLGMGGVVAASMLVPFLGLLAIPASIVGAAELHARHHRRHQADGARGRS